MTKQSFCSSSSAAIIVTGNIGEVTGETGTGGQTITGKTGEVTGSTGAVGHKAIPKRGFAPHFHGFCQAHLIHFQVHQELIVE